MSHRTDEKGMDSPAVNQKKPRSNKTFVGCVVSATSSKLIMTTRDGKEHTHMLAKDVKFTCDGESCRLESLLPGSQIRITTLKDGRNLATSVEVLNKHAELARLE